jgi:DNA-binding NtrC family response regulator
MRAAIKRAEQVAASEASVLINGESGTGKEVLARHLHRKSRRSAGPFVALNCAAIPDNLLESELFGHEKGAFSGAVARRIGKFEAANGGTLLLDEISEMDVRLQAKLLRALQEREIDRLGGGDPVKVNVRILATTNRDLEVEVKAGRFREDLFYRLNVINIVLPPLRERTGDIPVLVDFFLSKYADIAPFGRCTLGEDAQDKLMTYSWPGNVRELENTIYRAALLASGPVVTANEVILTSEQKTYYQALLESSTPASSPQPSTWHNAAMPQPGATPPSAYAANVATVAAAKGFGQIDTPPPVVSPATEAAEDPLDPTGSATIGTFVGQTIAAVEQELILATLDRCLGNRTQAAHILGISIQTLRNKLDRYGA